MPPTRRALTPVDPGSAHVAPINALVDRLVHDALDAAGNPASVTLLDSVLRAVEAGEVTLTTPAGRAARPAASGAVAPAPVAAPAWQALLRLAGEHGLMDVLLRGDGTLVVTAPSPGYAEVTSFIADTTGLCGVSLRVVPAHVPLETLEDDGAPGAPGAPRSGR